MRVPSVKQTSTNVSPATLLKMPAETPPKLEKKMERSFQTFSLFR